VISGGKFANGAVSTATTWLFNDKGDQILKQSKARRNVMDEAMDANRLKNGKPRERLKITRKGLAQGFSDVFKVATVTSITLTATYAVLAVGSATVAIGANEIADMLSDVLVEK